MFLSQYSAPSSSSSAFAPPLPHITFLIFSHFHFLFLLPTCSTIASSWISAILFSVSACFIPTHSWNFLVWTFILFLYFYEMYIFCLYLFLHAPLFICFPFLFPLFLLHWQPLFFTMGQGHPRFFLKGLVLPAETLDGALLMSAIACFSSCFSFALLLYTFFLSICISSLCALLPLGYLHYPSNTDIISMWA